MTTGTPAGASLLARVRPIIVATGLSSAGDGALSVAVPLLAVSLTRAPFTVALTEVASSAALILFLLPVGVFIDRNRNYRRIMITADLCRAGVLAVLGAVIIAHRLSIPVLLVAVFATAAGLCFFHPANQVIIPAISGTAEGDLTEVNGRYWALVGAAPDAGQPLGSLAFAVTRSLPIVADAVSFAASALLLRRLPPTPCPVREDAPRESVRGEIRDGIRHVMATPDLRVLLAGTVAGNTGMLIAGSILVLYVREILGVPPWAFGVLLAAGGAGALLAGRYAKRLTRHLAIRQTMAVSLALTGGTWIGIAAAGTVWVTAVLLVIQGGAITICNVTGSTAMQMQTPVGLLGRVDATWGFAAVIAGGVGGLAGGIIASQAGLTTALATAGVLAAGCAPLMLIRRREVARKLQDAMS